MFVTRYFKAQVYNYCLFVFQNSIINISMLHVLIIDIKLKDVALYKL